MDSWLQELIRLLPEGASYLGALFLVSFFESLPLIGLLMPGSSLIVFAGFLAFHDKGTFTQLFLIASVGALTGDLISFWLGSRYGSTLLKMRWFQRKHQMVKRAEQYFVDHGGKSIFFARFIGPIRGITPFIAGISGMSGRSFCYYTVISSLLWGLSYPGTGYLGGHSWEKAQGLSLRFGLLLGAARIATIIHTWVKRNVKGEEGRSKEKGER